MKTIVTGLILGCLLAPASAQTNAYQKRGLSLDPVSSQSSKHPIIDYPMRDMSMEDPRFTSIFAEISAALKREARQALGMVGLSASEKNEIARLTIDKSSPPRCGPILDVVTIVQTLAPGDFLGRLSHDPAAKNFRLNAPGQSWPDGKTIRCKIHKSPDLFSYTSVTGAVLTVSSYTYEADTYESITPAIFSEKLRAGETFLIQHGTKIDTCKTCAGAGRIPVTSGKRNGDGKVECKTCVGKGKFTAPQIIRIKW
jgi:hypothetical protein